MNLPRAALALLINRRLTALIVEDKLTEPLRDEVLRRFPRDTTQLGYLVTCTRCTSVWAGLVTLLLLTLANNRAVKAVAYSLALSEATIITDRLLDSLDTGFDLR